MRLLFRISFTLFLSFNFKGLSQNLINNGSFELGGSGIGFVAGGNGYNQLNPPFSGNTNAGDYAFTTNPQLVNNQYFVSSGDHTSGNGKMMVVDGTNVGGQQRFWKAGNNGGGICNLMVGQSYIFSYWIRSVADGNFADILIAFLNASNITLVAGSTIAPQESAGWKQVVYSFVANNQCVNIELYNNNTASIGNDFAIDDLSVLEASQPLGATYSATQLNCSSPSSGLIAIYPKGGVAPYLFNLSGTALTNTISNTTGVFSGLSAGTYTFFVTDANGSNFNEQGVSINSISSLFVNPQDTTICPGNSVTMIASGGTGSYVWASSNNSEIGFPSTNSTISVSPAITTTYTVSSNVTNQNLITNGDFEQGNTGFKTDYKYFTPDNPTGAQKAYGVVSNPKSWFNNFDPCVDHTSGSGKMMVVDGSNFNLGTDPFWCQKIAVEPNKNYVFTFWVTSVSALSPAVIKTNINGSLLGSFTLNNATCNWTKVTYNWNSSNNTLVEICLIDANYESTGNDFAIDDITFTTNSNCSKQSTVSVQSENGSLEFSYPTPICLNQGIISPYLNNNFIQGGFFQAEPTGLSLGSIGGNLNLNESNIGTYTITYTSPMCGLENEYILVLAPCEIVIPSAFTPNNDQENDFWELVNIDDNYPKNLIRIYNRWGNVIFESERGAYNSNPWDGRYNGKPLPVGSYFYIIELTDDGSIEPMNGTVSIILKR
jgi:gliding motility-associated-like protein